MAVRCKRLSVRRDQQIILKVTGEEYAILSKLAYDEGIFLDVFIVGRSGKFEPAGNFFYYPRSSK